VLGVIGSARHRAARNAAATDDPARAQSGRHRRGASDHSGTSS
jgi:hypothetical protein